MFATISLIYNLLVLSYSLFSSLSTIFLFFYHILFVSSTMSLNFDISPSISFPVTCSPFVSCHVLSFLLLSRALLSSPVTCSPFLFSPVTCSPFLSCHVLTYLFLLRALLSSPLLLRALLFFHNLYSPIMCMKARYQQTI